MNDMNNNNSNIKTEIEKKKKEYAETIRLQIYVAPNVLSSYLLFRSFQMCLWFNIIY